MQRKFKIKACPKCKTEHTKSGIYCSRSCANSRKFTQETRDKISNTNRKNYQQLSVEQREARERALRSQGRTTCVNTLDRLLTDDFGVLGMQSKRMRVIVEQNAACNHCGLTHWRDQRITLELEHKDGDNSNNARENLEALCPNCHSLTPTWRGRKNKRLQTKLEQRLDMLGI